MLLSSGPAALEKNLLSCIFEEGKSHLFGPIPSTLLLPGIPEVSSIVRKPPYRKETDTNTFNGDFRRVQKVVRITKQRPSAIKPCSDVSL